MKRRALGFAAGACLAVARPAWAGGLKGLPDPGIEDYNFVIGPSLALAAVADASSELALGLDATYSYSLLWGSLGARFVTGEQWVAMPYGEVGLWLLANIGAGCTVVQGGARSGQVAPHLFLGVPLPVSPARSNSFRRTVVLEPYYRPTWFEGNALHEVGVLLKVVAWSRKARSDYDSPPPPPRSEPPLVDPTPAPGRPEVAPPAEPEEPPLAPLAP